MADDLDAAERKAVLHREGAGEACMSWRTARSLHSLGIMPRVTRYQRLTPFGLKVRAALQDRETP